MTTSNNSKNQWKQIFCNVTILLGVGASAALILRELREHAKTLECLVEEQRHSREQSKSLLSSTQRLSNAVDALSAELTKSLPDKLAGAATTHTADSDKTGGINSGLSRSKVTKDMKAVPTRSVTAKLSRAKKNRTVSSESDENVDSQ